MNEILMDFFPFFFFRFSPNSYRSNSLDTVPKTYPIVCLKNIWEELADAGIATNLLPPGDIRNTISIRYDTKTISLFGDDG